MDNQKSYTFSIFLNFHSILQLIHTLLSPDFVDRKEDSLAVQIMILPFQSLFLVKNFHHFLKCHKSSNKNHISFFCGFCTFGHYSKVIKLVKSPRNGIAPYFP